MKKSRISPYTLTFLIFLLAMFVETVASFFYSRILFSVSGGIFLILLIFSIYKIRKRRIDSEQYMTDIIKNLSYTDAELLDGVKLPMLASNKSGIVIWYNDAFRSNIISDEPFYNAHIDGFFGKSVLDELDRFGYAEFKFNQDFYIVYKNTGNTDLSTDLYYFVDITALKMITLEYKRSRPVVALIMIDNISEILRDAKDSEKAVLTGEIEDLIENWASNSTGFLRKIGDNKFIMVMEERHIRKYMTDGFDILEKVRNLKAFGKGGATLSIGIGRDAKTLAESEKWANQALDMSLGRGGDHVAIKSGDNYEFFGGVSGGMESRTRVKSRVIATALKELIDGSDTVLVMGHHFGDLDSVGSSIGIMQIARSLGKEAFIVTDKSQSLAKQLLSKLQSIDQTAIISRDEANSLITDKTLLVIVDTHRPEFLEFKDIYEKTEKVVVIDHHRKTVEHIDNAVVFYHEPNASSASEMVAEMAQYMGPNILGAFEAEALLSGIMLDTRNFIIRTGVRTFETAGYLRGLGANPVEVKRLFSSSMPGYKLKSTIVASAERYGHAALSFVDQESDDVRVAAAQAADELLSIEGVQSAFVFFKTDSTVNISARSMGDVNVQLIMEELGGGGHQTMSAAQLKDSNFEEARTKLCIAIDNYNKKNRKENK